MGLAERASVKLHGDAKSAAKPFSELLKEKGTFM
jgi:hypothetical protein